ANCSGNWTIAGTGNTGYHALQIYDISGQIHTSTPIHSDLYVGMQDNGISASPDDGGTWENGTCGDVVGLQSQRMTSGLDDSMTIAATWGCCGPPCPRLMGVAHLAGAGKPFADAGSPLASGPIVLPGAPGTYLEWIQQPNTNLFDLYLGTSIRTITSTPTWT